MKQYQVHNLAENEQKKGRYLMDYSRKYQAPYDVVERARMHVIHQKQQEKSQNGSKEA